MKKLEREIHANINKPNTYKRRLNSVRNEEATALISGLESKLISLKDKQKELRKLFDPRNTNADCMNNERQKQIAEIWDFIGDTADRIVATVSERQPVIEALKTMAVPFHQA